MSWLKRFRKAIKLPPLQAYNLWASSYAIENNPIKQLSDAFLKRAATPLKNKSLLDCGCGTGNFCIYALEQGASKVTGIDLSPAMIDVAKSRCPAGEFSCVDLNMAAIRPNHYDVVVSALVLGHLKSIEGALEKMCAAIKPGGTLVLTDFHPYQTIHGSRRTFKTNNSNDEYEVIHYLHLFEEYFRMLSSRNMTITSLEEPLFKGNPVIFCLTARKALDEPAV
jgi:malonyl-CoA O-methyltransferase